MNFKEYNNLIKIYDNISEEINHREFNHKNMNSEWIKSQKGKNFFDKTEELRSILHDIGNAINNLTDFFEIN